MAPTALNKREVEAKSMSIVIINNQKELDLIDKDGTATYLFDHVFVLGHTMQGNIEVNDNGDLALGARILLSALLNVMQLSRSNKDQGIWCSVAVLAVQI
ncbi:hypothetical protein GGF32_004840 [Allomyces javanicus]|nr:hypothetical protein GGF32_004840 [Allomyces javanicus]